MIRIAGERAILDETHCPPNGGPYVITAYVKHDDAVTVFFTMTNAQGSIGSTRGWFMALLRDVKFAQ